MKKESKNIERYVFIHINTISGVIIQTKRSNSFTELMDIYRDTKIDFTKKKYILNVYQGTIEAKE